VADGIPFMRPPVADGQMNCIGAAGQTIEWPAQKTPALAVLGVGSNGRQGGMATLLYADGTEQTVDLSFGDWCVGVGGGEMQAFRTESRIVEGATAPTATSVWMRRIPANAEKALRGIRLPTNPNLHVFGMAFAGTESYETLWGVSVLNDCKYGYDAKGNTLRLSLLRSSYDPDPIADQGRHRIRFSVLPHKGDWRSAGTPRRAHEFNNQPIVHLAESHAGTLPASYGFLRVEPKEMILSALKLAEDGNGLIARVYNGCGVGGTARIISGLPLASAEATNLLEERRLGSLATMEGQDVVLDLNGKLHGTVRLGLQ
jgi:hypothetical protein